MAISRIRLLLLALPVVVLFAYVVMVLVHEQWKGNQQDRCAFGKISNSQYSNWLARAGEHRTKHGTLLSNKTEKALGSARLDRSNNVRFDELAGGIVSIDERIAIVHAIMRTEKFLFVGVTPNSASPFEDSGGYVSLHYKRFSFRGLLFACLFGCEDTATARYSVRPGQMPQPLRSQLDQFDITYGEPSPKKAPRPERPPNNFDCPPTPSAAWVEKNLKL